MSGKTDVRAKLSLARTFRVPASFNDEAICNFLEAIRCARSLTVWLLYENKEFEQLVNLTIDPQHYNTVSEFRDAYTATSFLSKANFLPLSVSRSDAAFTKFFEYEELCHQTNRRFLHPAVDPLDTGPCAWLLNATKRKIECILGSFDHEEFANKSYWGPGVTTLLKGEDVSAVNKFQLETGITHELLNFIEPWFATAYPRWSEHIQSIGGFVPQKGNEVVTVPKNSKTDRVIAIEPGINLWFQKGVGGMIKRRMQRFGIDLRTQHVVNAELAKEGSITGLLATVDFSSASDSISKEVVRELIPHEWLQLMEVCRSKIGFRKDSSVIAWQKFSSMGNGFTFELESLIFYAAALAVCELEGLPTNQVSVFGDDVILPSSAFEAFVKFSEYLGFRVNTKKSFSSTCFRESCGSHYFDGSDCKPIYLKEAISNVQTVYKLANRIRNIAHRRNSFDGCDRRMRYAWSHLYYGIPKPLRFGVSAGGGDTGFHVNLDEGTPSLARDHHKYLGYEGWLAESLVETAVMRPFEETGLLLARISLGSEQPGSQYFNLPRLRSQLRQTVERTLYPPDVTAYGNSYTLRGRTRSKIQKVLVAQWYNMGAWT